MSIQLPKAFLDKMFTLLGPEYEAFLASYNEPRHYGLRVNTLKVAADEFERMCPFRLRPVPWTSEGFYYEYGDRPGKHPYYHAGLYYIQEPSAMAPAELLRVEPGDKVLDLCAAPGGKSTQIAAKMQGEGLLVSNDIQAERVKALVKNLAIFGVRNATVTNETPERLARVFAGFFDKIAIDAPCSGEGMFRKDEEMADNWGTHSTQRCVALQKDILEAAAQLLAPGGRIVYSTCTFAPEENEAMIARFLDRHPDFDAVIDEYQQHFAPGRPDWIGGSVWSTSESFSTQAIESVARTSRLWPHRLAGEGHYVAILQHRGEPARFKQDARSDGRARRRSDLGLWMDFMASNLTKPIEGEWVCYGDRVYWTNWELPDLAGLSVARPGWFVGTLKKNRFEPSQALAMGIALGDAKRSIHLDSHNPETIRYLKGETLIVPEERVIRDASVMPRGYCLIGIDGYPLGWGKWQDGILKNEYPAGWRWT